MYAPAKESGYNKSPFSAVWRTSSAERASRISFSCAANTSLDANIDIHKRNNLAFQLEREIISFICVWHGCNPRRERSKHGGTVHLSNSVRRRRGACRPQDVPGRAFLIFRKALPLHRGMSTKERCSGSRFQGSRNKATSDLWNRV